MDNLFHLYNDLLSENEDTGEPPLIASNSLRVPFAEGVDGDTGVEVEAKMPPDQLSFNLGFKDHLPFQFNKYHHSKGFSTWDSPSMLKPGQPHSDMQPQGLHYHQLAGVHAVIRKVFSEKPKEGPCQGILLADEVGLGKTAMAISVMAFLSHLVLLQASEAALPPIIRKASSLTKLFSLTLDFFYRASSLPR